MGNQRAVCERRQLHLTILQQIVSSSLKWWSSMHGVDTFVELLSRLVRQFTTPFHTSLHDQPCHKTMKKDEHYEGIVIYLSHRGNSRFKHGSIINCPQYLYFFHIVFECSPNIHNQRMMLVLLNRLLY